MVILTIQDFEHFLFGLHVFKTYIYELKYAQKNLTDHPRKFLNYRKRVRVILDNGGSKSLGFKRATKVSLCDIQHVMEVSLHDMYHVMEVTIYDRHHFMEAGLCYRHRSILQCKVQQPFLKLKGHFCLFTHPKHIIHDLKPKRGIILPIHQQLTTFNLLLLSRTQKNQNLSSRNSIFESLKFKFHSLVQATQACGIFINGLLRPIEFQGSYILHV